MSQMTKKTLMLIYRIAWIVGICYFFIHGEFSKAVVTVIIGAIFHIIFLTKVYGLNSKGTNSGNSHPYLNKAYVNDDHYSNDFGWGGDSDSCDFGGVDSGGDCGGGINAMTLMSEVYNQKGSSRKGFLFFFDFLRIFIGFFIQIFHTFQF
jgi:hypothetical protein